MVAILFIVLLALATAYLTYRLAGGLRLYLKLRGKRLVTCPETKKATAVKVAAGTVAVKALIGPLRLRLSECSCWPEHQNCGQECLRQIEAAPEDCLVWTIISRWYEGRQCAYCRKRFGELKWHDHRPALIGADRRTVQWDEIPTESLLDVLQTHWPVCWNCHMAQTFRREYPDLVSDQPRKH